MPTTPKKIEKNKEHPASAKNTAITTSIRDSLIPAIVSDGHPALRQVSEEVPLSEIKTTKIQNLIEDMKIALASQDDGIGLAAPQIGVPLRIFIVSKKVFGSTLAKGPQPQDLVFINPTITKFSKEKKWMEGEGCLSVRWVYGKVQRSTKVSIRAYDQFGRVFERGAGGLLAHIFQHEVDHLNGILFIDKAKDLEKVEQVKKADKSDKHVKKNSAKISSVKTDSVSSSSAVKIKKADESKTSPKVSGGHK